MKAQERKIKSMKLPVWLIALVEEKAKSERRSFTNMVEVLLANELSQGKAGK